MAAPASLRAPHRRRCRPTGWPDCQWHCRGQRRQRCHGHGHVNLDKTAPTISGAPDRAPNSNGWYNANVTVAFDCGDALLGRCQCTEPRYSGEGEDQSVTGTVTDNADNTASAEVSDLDIDTTAPILAGAPTTGPNGAGWYRDVAIEWTCSRRALGHRRHVPGEQHDPGEGENRRDGANIADRAGNHDDARRSAGSTSTRPRRPRKRAACPSAGSESNVDVSLNADRQPVRRGRDHSAILDGGDRRDRHERLDHRRGHAHARVLERRRRGQRRGRQQRDRSDRPSNPTITHTQTLWPTATAGTTPTSSSRFDCDDPASSTASAS